jgi:hypothetical protein
MMSPTATARAIPLSASADTATPVLRFFNIQPINAPLPAAPGTVIALQKTPAIGQMIEFIASGTTKQLRPMQPQ